MTENCGLAIGGSSATDKSHQVLYVFKHPGDKPGRQVQFNIFDATAQRYAGTVRISLDNVAALISELQAYVAEG